MKLVDAEKLIFESSPIAFKSIERLDEPSARFWIEIGIRRMMDMIVIAPEVDAVPVKHGHWIEKEKYEYSGLMTEKMFHTCNVCGEEQMQKLDNKFEPFLTPYCANCGAKMDGGTENA